MMTDLANLTAAVEAGNRTAATELTKAALDAGTDPAEVLGAMTAAMDAVGRRFEFAAQIGADGQAADAGAAVDLARRVLAG